MQEQRKFRLRQEDIGKTRSSLDVGFPSLFGQAGTGSNYGPKHAAYIDSIKNSEYTWKLPIWGKKVSKRGIDLPYNAGIMLNTYIGSQKILISDLKVGVNGKDPVPLDFIKFGEVKAKIQNITVRPDVWLLPFAWRLRHCRWQLCAN